MRRLRISLGRVMGVIVFLAIALASLKYPRTLWSSLFIALTTATLCLSLVGIVFRRGERQIFWVAYAVFGWVNFALMYPPADWYLPPQPARLATPYLHQWIHSAQTGPNEITMTLDADGQTAFYDITYSLGILVTAYLGAIVSQALFGDRPKSREASSDKSPV